MTDDRIDHITPEELEEVDGEPLPEREAMSVVPIGGAEGIVVIPGGGGEHTLPVEPPAES